MTVRYSEDLRDARLQAVATAMAGGCLLQIRSGARATNITDAPAGLLLAEIELPSSPFNTPSGGVMTKSGTWQDLLADDDGTAGHFVVRDPTDTFTIMDGAVTDTAGAGPLKLSSVAIVENQPVTVVTWTITAGNG